MPFIRLGKVKQWIDARNPDSIVPFCADFEKNLVDLDSAAAAALCKEKGCQTAIPKLIRTGATSHVYSTVTYASRRRLPRP